MLLLTSYSCHRNFQAGASETQERGTSSRLSKLFFVTYEWLASELLGVGITPDVIVRLA